MAEPTEDVPYSSIDEFATADEQKKLPDIDQDNKSILREVSEELEKDIAEQSGFDSMSLPANATREQKIAVFDEIAIHKGVAVHLRKYKIMIDSKLKEIEEK